MATGGVAERITRHVWHLKFAFMQEFDSESESESNQTENEIRTAGCSTGKVSFAVFTMQIQHVSVLECVWHAAYVMLNPSEYVVLISEC